MTQKTKFSTTLKHTVRWGEMDALNHVNNARYLSYFEDARIAYLDRIGYGSVSVQEGFGPILANISCNFKRPITFPDNLTIGVGVTRIGNSSFNVDYEIFSSSQDSIVATGTSVVVMVDYRTGKSTPVSDEIKEKIRSIDQIHLEN